VAGDGGARELALEMRVLIWGIGSGGAHRGRLTAAKQVGGGKPATAGRRRGGGHRLEVHGATVSSIGGHCGGGGACRWPKAALDGKVDSTGEEEGGRLDASTIPYEGRCLRVMVGLAWLRGARGRCSVVSVRRLEQRSATRGRAEWGGNLAVAEGEEENRVSA
jgi:hypothetical protein